MFSKGLLVGLGELLGTPGQQAAVSIVLQRAGPDGVEVMLDRLVTVQGMAERRTLFDALRHLREGRTQLIPMLTDPKWFVVRNVAELIGELGVEEAVPGLAQLLNHADERVRKAAALALAKIGTRAASEPLRRALRDPSPEVRVQVAMGVGGPRAQGLAMPLVVALDEEKDEAVQRELLLALGRIGTADAVQALLKVAQPAGRVFGRKPVALRLAAVDALRIAGTPPAIGALDGLKADGDREIGAAAQAALAELKRRQK
jgi:HEAT repeat protein